MRAVVEIWIVSVAGLCLAGSTLPAYAIFNGQQVLNLCLADKNSCDAYITGIADGVIGAQTLMMPADRRGVCIPSQVTYPTIESTIKGFLAQHPDLLVADAATLTFMALEDTWPCAGLRK